MASRGPTISTTMQRSNEYGPERVSEGSERDDMTWSPFLVLPKPLEIDLLELVSSTPLITGYSSSEEVRPKEACLVIMDVCFMAPPMQALKTNGAASIFAVMNMYK